MPEFILNKTPPAWDDTLSEFAAGYLEAAFFTNMDSGHDDEFKANELGTGRVCKSARARIIADCAAFETAAADLLALAYACDDYEPEQAGRDFWFTRQGHGVGYWDREQLNRDDTGEFDRLSNLMAVSRDDPAAWGAACKARSELPPSLGDKLTEQAKAAGETHFDIYGGWIH
jgi:hypothetical protein